MSTVDYSIGFTAPEIEEILLIQKQELKKTLASYADGGTSATKRRLDEIHTIIDACQRALQKLDPGKYPSRAWAGDTYVDRRLEL